MSIFQSFEPTLEEIDFLSRAITDEIVKSAGVAHSRFRRWLFSFALNPAARRFAHVAARFDHIVKQANFQQAARDLLDNFVDQIEVRGLENIPSQGPLLVAANHPGTYDGLSIISTLPRDDLKVVITGVPFTQELQHAGQHFIYSPPMEQTYGRMETLRSSVRHLQGGGSLLLFPTGHVDPDPALAPGAEQALERWSRSLELLLRKAPNTQVVLTIVSGVLTHNSLHHPLTRLLHTIENYKTAQIVQVAGQLFSPGRNKPTPQISFGRPFVARQLLELLPGGSAKSESGEAKTLLYALVERAKQRLAEHLDEYGILPRDGDGRLAVRF
jgi:hypothetical protein